MPVRCPKCGKELQRGALRCRFCGADAREAPDAGDLVLTAQEAEQLLDAPPPKKP